MLNIFQCNILSPQYKYNSEGKKFAPKKFVKKNKKTNFIIILFFKSLRLFGHGNINITQGEKPYLKKLFFKNKKLNFIIILFVKRLSFVRSREYQHNSKKKTLLQKLFFKERKKKIINKKTIFLNFDFSLTLEKSLEKKKETEDKNFNSPPSAASR